jgi:hypothetical protein
VDVSDAAMLQEAAELPTEFRALIGTNFPRAESADKFVCETGDIFCCFVG